MPSNIDSDVNQNTRNYEDVHTIDFISLGKLVLYSTLYQRNVYSHAISAGRSLPARERTRNESKVSNCIYLKIRTKIWY